VHCFVTTHSRASLLCDVQNYGKDAYLHTGMYTFLVGPEDARTPVEARFSYMWRRVAGDWKIVHHHRYETSLSIRICPWYACTDYRLFAALPCLVLPSLTSRLRPTRTCTPLHR
jgi:hypothetical protein